MNSIFDLSSEILCLANGDKPKDSASNNTWIIYGYIKSIEAEKKLLTKELHEAREDLEFRRGLYKLLQKQYEDIQTKLHIATCAIPSCPVS
jgi:hypothetical protein